MTVGEYFNKLGVDPTIFDQTSQALASLSSSVAEMGRHWVDATEPVRHSYELLRKSIAALPESSAITQAYLADRSWYLTGFSTPSDVHRLAQLVRDNRHAEIEAYMQDLARYSIDPTRTLVETACPRRSPAILEAIDAHEEKRFLLSVPVLLAQADGLCMEVLRFDPFSDGESKLRKRQERLQAELAFSFGRIFYGQLAADNALGWKEEKQKRPLPPGMTAPPLNRHTVLHGRDLDYGTEANSLRAIAMVSLLLTLLGRAARLGD